MDHPILYLADQADYDDIKAIEQILSEKNVICSSYQKNLFDQYSHLDYRKQIDFNKIKFSFILDRNIFSDIISFAKKDATSQITNTQKTAFALLAFIQRTDGLIYPMAAVYEYMDSNSYDEALNEYSLFLCIDNLPNQVLIDIALGRINSIPPNLIKPFKVDPIPNLKGEDRSVWKLHYGLTLKLASIEITGSKDKTYDKPYEKIKTFLKWIHKDYIFSAPAVVFGLIYFSEKRIKKMVKNIRSGNKDMLIKGIRNAAWDMTIAWYWADLFTKNRKRSDLLFFCTEDKALKEVIPLIIATNALDSEIEEKVESMFLHYLGKNEGTKINMLYKSLMSNINDGTRTANGWKCREDLCQYIDVLENELINIAFTDFSVK